MKTDSNLILIGEKTWYKYDMDFLHVTQRIKYHLVLTTVLIGVVVWFWFGLWFISVPIICLGLTELLIVINIKIDIKSNSVEKSLHIKKYKILKLYSLGCFNDYELIEYQSGRGSDGTIPSFEVGLAKGIKIHELLSFSDSNVRHKLYTIISTFIKGVDKIN